MQVQDPPEDSILTRARRVVDQGFGPARQRPFSVRYWNGYLETGGLDPDNRTTLVIRAPGVLRTIFIRPSELALSEAFLRGDLEVEGELEPAVSFGHRLGRRLSTLAILAQLAWLASRLPANGTNRAGASLRPRRWIPGPAHSRARDAAAIRHHYDVGNEFYRLWLDRETIYSAAYFASGVHDLDEAQQRKLGYICRKLGLRDGDRLLDIGCGWGALIRHAARHFGVDATGITLSPSQEALASRRILEEELRDRCRAELRDYRDLHDLGVFDKISSVGMFEHVGRSRLRAYFKSAYAVLRPGGLLLNSGIVDLEAARRPSLGVRAARWLWGEGRFLQRYIFPDGELLPLAEVIGAAEHAGFETRDVECMREHYLLTVRRWVERLEARREEATALVGEATFRTWRLYLAASASAFATGRIGHVQIVLAKSCDASINDPPPTREGLYRVERPRVRKTTWREPPARASKNPVSH
jgi:cyclopropane-fatty-acyl-phospholipid synthase